MVNKRKRRFWQFQLSTALFMTLLTGILIGANSLHRECAYDPQNGADIELFWITGFPLTYAAQSMTADEYNGRVYAVRQSDLVHQRPSAGMDTNLLALNGVMGLAIVIAAALVYEWLLRRQEDRKQ